MAEIFTIKHAAISAAMGDDCALSITTAYATAAELAPLFGGEIPAAALVGALLCAEKCSIWGNRLLRGRLALAAENDQKCAEAQEFTALNFVPPGGGAQYLNYIPDFWRDDARGDEDNFFEYGYARIQKTHLAAAEWPADYEERRGSVKQAADGCLYLFGSRPRLPITLGSAKPGALFAVPLGWSAEQIAAKQAAVTEANLAAVYDAAAPAYGLKTVLRREQLVISSIDGAMNAIAPFAINRKNLQLDAYGAAAAIERTLRRQCLIALKGNVTRGMSGDIAAGAVWNCINALIVRDLDCYSPQAAERLFPARRLFVTARGKKGGPSRWSFTPPEMRNRLWNVYYANDKRDAPERLEGGGLGHTAAAAIRYYAATYLKKDSGKAAIKEISANVFDIGGTEYRLEVCG